MCFFIHVYNSCIDDAYDDGHTSTPAYGPEGRNYNLDTFFYLQ